MQRTPEAYIAAGVSRASKWMLVSLLLQVTISAQARVFEIKAPDDPPLDKLIRGFSSMQGKPVSLLPPWQQEQDFQSGCLLTTTNYAEGA